MNHELRQARRWFNFIFIGFGAIALVSTITALLAFASVVNRGKTAAIYTGYVVGASSVCVGDPLKLHLELTVADPPAVVSSVDSWWSVEQRNTAIFGTPRVSIITSSDLLSREVTVVVPPLPPGAYLYNRATLREGREPNVVSFNVVIKDCNER